jgi:hypothetical protein
MIDKNGNTEDFDFDDACTITDLPVPLQQKIQSYKLNKILVMVAILKYSNIKQEIGCFAIIWDHIIRITVEVKCNPYAETHILMHAHVFSNSDSCTHSVLLNYRNKYLPTNYYN